MARIDNEKYPFMKRIIVENKSDIMPEEENEEIKKLLHFYPFLEHIKISLKKGDNFENLLIKIYEEINPKQLENNLFPLDKVAKYVLKDQMKKSADSISLIILGDTGVGKSILLPRYSRNILNHMPLVSIGMDKDIKILKINNKDYYKLTIWDTPGQERLRSFPKRYYRNVDGILLLFDINDKSSFEDLNNWISDVNENIDTGEEGEEKDVVIYLIGNKIDLIDSEEGWVTKEKIEGLANFF